MSPTPDEKTNLWMAARPAASAKASAAEEGEPGGKLLEEINKQFGSFDEFKNKFNEESISLPNEK